MTTISNRFTKRIRQKVYNWHRIIGLITVIPVIFWTISGLMHPFMSHWFKQTLPKEKLETSVLNKEQLKFSLQDILKENQITEFLNFRIVSFDKETFYQIKDTDRRLRYFNSQTGKELKNGDILYAEFLARYFLDDKKSKITGIHIQSEFKQEYKYVNRLLPVFKVSFQRDDEMDVYVETLSGRLATYNDAHRKNFLWIFDVFHNWSFLDKIANNSIRIMAMVSLLSVIILSALSGISIYGLLWKSFKKPQIQTSKNILKKYHRQIGIATAFVTLTFAFSGAYHAIMKFNPDTETGLSYEPVMKTKNINFDFLNLETDWERLNNASAIVLKKDTLLQLFYNKTEENKAEIIYYSASNGKLFQDGDIRYSKFLANKFSNVWQSEDVISPACCVKTSNTNQLPLFEVPLISTEIVSSFTREYGFVNKRLPVIKLSYDTPDQDTYYIETSTSTLAAHINSAKLTEGYSFAILHKFLFMDWAGKNIRDISMLISALGVLIVSLFGLSIFLKNNY